MKRHEVNKHSTVRAHQCPFCEYSTHENYRIQKHIKVTHLKEYNFRCPMCEYATSQACTLKKHVQNVHKRPIQCKFCPQILFGSANFKKHINIEHKKMYYCSYCGFKTGSNEYLKNHLSSEHGMTSQTHICDICNFSTTNRFVFGNHLNTMHPKLRCSICNFETISKELLASHEETVHFSFNCFACCVYFPTSDCLLEHTKQSHPQSDTCGLCGYFIAENDVLMEHLEAVHDLTYNSSLFQKDGMSLLSLYKPADALSQIKSKLSTSKLCEICEFIPTDAAGLKEHLETMHNVNYVLLSSPIVRYQPMQKCWVCDFTCFKLSDLQMHLNRVHGEALYKCHKCKYSTDNAHAFSKHLRSKHSSDGTHQCKMCAFSSTSSTVLIKHIKLKHKERKGSVDNNIKCEYCSFSCSKQVSLKLHMLRMHKDKEIDFSALPSDKFDIHLCPYCSFTTYLSDKLLWHVKEKHIDKYKVFINTREKISGTLVPNGKVDFSKCQICRAHVTTLKTHQYESHSNSETLDCPYCHFNDYSLKKLISHFSERHIRIENYSCYYCLFESSIKKEFKDHMKSAHFEFCVECSCHLEEFTTHIKEAHSVLKCEMCDFKSGVVENVAKHGIESHAKRYSCKKCKFNTPYFEDFIVHSNSHLVVVDVSYKCPKCDFQSNKSQELAMHFYVFHVNNDVISTCNNCITSAFVIKEFQNHICEFHMDSSVPLVCSVCDSYSIITRELFGHLKINHKNRDGEICRSSDPFIADIRKLNPGVDGNLICPFCETDQKHGSLEQVISHVKIDHEYHIDLNSYDNTCPYCDIVFPSAESKRSHVDSTHQKSLLHCSFCSFRFSKPQELICHLKSLHPQEESYFCSGCEFKSSGIRIFEEHLKRQHNVGNSIRLTNKEQSRKHILKNCLMCNFCYTKSFQFVSHVLQDHQAEEKYLCPECDFEADYCERMLLHYRRKHKFQSRQKCPKCNFTTGSGLALKDHLRKSHANVVSRKQVRCLICGAKSNSPSELKKHLESAHRSEGWLQCPHCKYQGLSMLSMKKHLRRKHGGEVYHKCVQCTFISKTSQELLDHLRENHSSHPFQFQCEHCNFLCSSSSELTLHINNIHDTAYECLYCNFYCKTLKEFRCHVDVSHPDKSTYCCSSCGFVSSFLGKVMEHLLLDHTNAKVYNCPCCDYSSSHLLAVLSHVDLKHAKTPQHRCPFCLDYLGTVYNLSEHLKIKHSDESPLLCTDCEFKSIIIEDYVSHLRENHDDIVDYTSLACTNCDYTAKSIPELFSHFRKTHVLEGSKNLNVVPDVVIDRSLQCFNCEHKVFSNEDMIMHFTKEHFHNGILVDLRCYFLQRLYLHRTEKGCDGSCNTCNFFAFILEQLMFHDLEHPCPECDFSTKNLQDLNRHYKRFHAHCDSSSIRLVLFSQFNSHLEKPHPSSKCKKCDSYGLLLGLTRFEVRKSSKGCAHCSANVEILIKHMKPVLYDCSLCHLQFPLKSLVVHIKEKHSGKEAYTCPICQFSVLSLENLMTHFDEKHQVEDLTWRPMILELLDHIQVEHTEDNVLKCELCGFITFHKDSFYMHRKKFHGFLCRQCPNSFVVPGKLKSHLKSEHSPESSLFKCVHCSYESCLFAEFKAHMKSTHSDEKALMCDKCDYRTGLMTLMRNHSSRKHHDCPHCPYSSISLSELLHHVKGSHGETEESVNLHQSNSKPSSFGAKQHDKISACPFCLLNAETTAILIDHVTEFHSLTPIEFKCFYCDFCSISFNELTDHSHEEGSRQSYILKNSCDLLVSENDKCAFCNFRFTHFKELLSHFQINHKDNLPFKCPVCQFRTLIVSDLFVHMIKNHRDFEEYRCDFCNLGLLSVFDFISHVDKYHKSEKQPNEIQFNNRQYLGNTIFENESEIKNYVCSECLFTAVDEGELSKHMDTCQKTGSGGKDNVTDSSQCVLNLSYLQNIQIQSDEIIECPLCGCQTSNLSIYHDHIKESHICHKQCSQCDRFINRLRELIENPDARCKDGNSSFHCDFSTSLSENLVTHACENHTQEPLDNCVFCVSGHNYSPQLISHIQTSHMCEDILTCPNCQLCLSIFEELRSESGGDCVIACPLCEFSMDIGSSQEESATDLSLNTFECKFSESLLEDLMGHSCENHRGNNEQCSLCQKGTNFSSELILHVEQEHMCNKDKKCQQCEFTLSLFEELAGEGDGSLHECPICHCDIFLDHINNLTKPQCKINKNILEKLLECSEEPICCLCKFKGDSLLEVAQHLKECCHMCGSCHNCKECVPLFEKISNDARNETKAFECPQCKFETLQLEELQKHVSESHSGELRLMCTFCETILMTIEDLIGHIVENHPSEVLKSPLIMNETDLEPHKCAHCEYTGVSSDMKKHLIEVHRVVEVFSCSHCLFRAVGKMELLNHLAFEHPSENQICGQCDFEGSLEDIKTHICQNGDTWRTFKCPHCNFKSVLENDVLKHVILAHMKRKPEFCSFCNFEGTPELLKVHLKEVHKIYEVFRCPYCSFVSGQKDSIIHHIQKLHTNGNLLNCTLCSFQGLEEDIKLHMEVNHQISEDLRCPKCHFTCTREIDLNDHIKIEHSGYVKCLTCLFKAPPDVLKKHKCPNIKLYKCPQCVFESCSKKDLMNHLSAFHAGANLQLCFHCEFCGTGAEMKKHLKNKHQAYEVIKCPHCDFRSEIEEKVTDHVLNTHEKKGDGKTAHRPKPTDVIASQSLLICPYCSFKAVLNDEIIKHISTTHMQQNSAKCLHCDFEGFPDELENHIKEAHKPLKCSKCKFVAVLEEELCWHVDECHSNGGHACLKCNFQSKTENELMKHISTNHQNEAVYRCIHCNFKTFSSNALILHSLSRHSLYNMTCPCCELVFFSPYSLSCHIGKNHSDSENFKCYGCSFHSSKRSEIVNHISQEHGGITYLCPGCKFKSATKEDIRVHYKQLHEIPLRCPHCPFSPSNLKNLRNHLNDVHPGLPEQNTLVYNLKYAQEEVSTMFVGDVLPPNHSIPWCNVCFLKFPSPRDFQSHVCFSDAAVLISSSESLFTNTEQQTLDDSNVAQEMQEGITSELIVNKCIDCAYITLELSDLKKHIEECHPVLTNVIGSKAYVDQKCLNEREVSKNCTLWCKICLLKFTSASDFQSHSCFIDSASSIVGSESSLSHRTPSVLSNVAVTQELPCTTGKSIDNQIERLDFIVHKCNECAHISVELSDLEKHIEECHRMKNDTLSATVDSITEPPTSGEVTVTKEQQSAVDETIHDLNERSDFVLHKCLKCAHITVELSDLEKHIQECHQGTNDTQAPSDIGPVEASGTKNTEGVENSRNLSFECPYCKSVVLHPQALTKHIRETHCYGGNFNCLHCYFSASSLFLLMYHTSDKHSELKIFKCSQCPLKFIKIEEFESHIDIMHRNVVTISENAAADDIDAASCPCCEVICLSSDELLTHIQKTHIDLKGHKCLHCEYRPMDFSELKSHMSQYHNDDNCYMCLECDFQFGTSACLVQHLKNVHNSENKWNCEFCDFTAISKGYLEGHVSQKHSLKQIVPKCNLCCVHFLSFQEGKKHFEDVHPEFHECEICGYITVASDEMMIHRGMFHNTKRSLKCPLCNEEYVDGEPLRKHLRWSHTKDGVHRCIHCTYNTFSYYELKSHLKQVHSDDNSLMCPLCDYRSTQTNAYRLTYHFKSKHLPKDKPPSSSNPPPSVVIKNMNKKCDYCDQLMSSPDEITKHIESDHIERCLNSCPFCKQKFKLFLNCRKHIEEVHKDNMYFYCGFCDFENCLLGEFLCHTQENHMINMSCRKCSFESFVPSFFLDHVKKNHSAEETPLLCQNCNFETSVIEDFEKHLSDHSPLLYICSRCKFEINSEDDYIKHMTINHGNKKKLECAHCEFTTDTLERIMRHAKECHSIHYCPTCTFESSKFEDYSSHLKTEHNDDKCYLCTECKFRGNANNYVFKHMRSHFSGQYPYTKFDSYRTIDQHRKDNNLVQHFLAKAMVSISARAMVLLDPTKEPSIQTPKSSKACAVKKALSPPSQEPGVQTTEACDVKNPLLPTSQEQGVKFSEASDVRNAVLAPSQEPSVQSSEAFAVKDALLAPFQEPSILYSESSEVCDDNEPQQTINDNHASFNDAIVETGSNLISTNNLPTNLNNGVMNIDEMIRQFCEKAGQETAKDLLKFDCTHCFQEMLLISHHMSQSHKKRRASKCPCCPFKARQILSLINHFSRAHVDPELVKCSYCPFTSKSSEFLEHCGTSHGDEGYCQVCASLLERFISHIKATHLKTDKEECLCPSCGSQVESLEKLFIHFSEMHAKDNADFKCTHCELHALTLEKFNSHVKALHISPKNLICSVCNMFASILGSLTKKNWHQCSLKEVSSDCIKKAKAKEKTVVAPCKEKTVVAPCKEKTVVAPCKEKTVVVPCEEKTIVVPCEEKIVVVPCEERIPTAPKIKKRVHYFECGLCPFVTSSNEELVDHLETHNFNECIHCQFQSVHLDVIIEHMKETHSDEAAHECNKCDFVSGDLPGFLEHLFQIHSYKCRHCPFSTVERQLLAVHSEQHAIHSCDECPNRYVTKELLLNHHRKFHRTTFRCGKCDYTSKYKPSLRYHQRRDHSKRKHFDCFHCVFSSNEKRGLVDHINSVHLLYWPFNCSLCTFKTTRRCKFKLHMRTAHLIKKGIMKMNRPRRPTNHKPL